MEEMQRSKRRRVYSLQPNAVVYTSFSLKYMSYLLPGLLKATSDSSYGGDKDKEMEKKVRFEVDMALVLSAGDFRWSRALKHMLEQDINPSKVYRTTGVLLTGKHNSHFGIVEKFNQLRPPPPIPKPLVPVEPTRPKRVSGRSTRKKMFRREEELGCRVRILRRILPGGNEMGMCELFSEVESYVLYLQFQVNILKSLVTAH